ncbi:MAG: hypothetical protein N2595_10605, partial [bacterium]|nr:hypothetical protein [bacterium]
PEQGEGAAHPRHEMPLTMITSPPLHGVSSLSKSSQPPLVSPPAMGVCSAAAARVQCSLSDVLRQLQATQEVTYLVQLIGKLGQLDPGSPRVLEVCRQLLAHPDPRVRKAVLEELWFFDDIAVLTTDLARHLYDAEADVRVLAAERLGEIETAQAIEILIQNLTNRLPGVAEACQEALLLAVAERFDTPEQAYRWWAENHATWFED